MPLKMRRGLWGGGIKFYSLHIAQLRGDSISAIFPFLIYLHLCVCLWVSPVLLNPLDSATLIASPPPPSPERKTNQEPIGTLHIFICFCFPLSHHFIVLLPTFSSSSILFYFFHHCKAEIGQDSTFCLEVSPTLHHKLQPTHPDKKKKINPNAEDLANVCQKKTNTLFVEMNRVYVSSFRGYYTITRVPRKVWLKQKNENKIVKWIIDVILVQ